VLRKDHALKVSRIRQRIATMREKGRGEQMIRLNEAQIARQDQLLTEQESDLAKRRNPQLDLHDPMAGCLVRVTKRSVRR